MHIYAKVHTPVIVKGPRLHFPNPKHLCLEQAITILVLIQTNLLIKKKSVKKNVASKTTSVSDGIPECINNIHRQHTM